jgi:hypothetical protein
MFHLLSILWFFASSIWYAVSACLFLFSSLLKLCSKRWKLVVSCQKPDVIYTYAPSCIYKYTILAYIYLYNYSSQSVSQHILTAFENFRVSTDARGCAPSTSEAHGPASKELQDSCRPRSFWTSWCRAEAAKQHKDHMWLAVWHCTM